MLNKAISALLDGSRLLAGGAPGRGGRRLKSGGITSGALVVTANSSGDFLLRPAACRRPSQPESAVAAKLKVSKKAPMQRHEGGYYIRMLAVDKPGTAATIAKRLAQHNISMESIVQRHAGPPATGAEKAKGPVPVILITYATTEDAVRARPKAPNMGR